MWGVSQKSTLIIPAYTRSGQGLHARIHLEARRAESFTVSSNGSVANALEKLFSRSVHILSSLKSTFSILESFHYTLNSTESGFRVMDARSAGLPVCLSLLNLLRKINGQQPVDGLAGTGVLRSDGSFETSSFETCKEAAISRDFPHQKKFINALCCKHVFDLEALLNAF